MDTEDFLNLEIKQVVEWVSSDDIKVSSEKEVFKGIVKWVSYNRSEREGFFLDLLRHIRLRSIPHNFLLKDIVKEELVTRNNDCLNYLLGSMESIIIPTEESLTKAPRNCLKVQVEGIFVCGGRRALCYLPHVDAWYQIGKMTFEHQNHAAIQYREKVYIFSKQEVHVSSDVHVIEYYVPSTNCWGSIQTDFGYDEQFSSLSVLSGYSYLYALTNDADIPESTVFSYDPDENFWKVKGDEDSRNRWGACGIANGPYLYIVGGTDRENSTATGITKVEKFDPSNVSFEEVAPLNEARHDAFGAAMNDKIYVAGGIQMRELRSILLNTCEVYTPSTNEWHLMVSLQVPCHSASMVCFKGALYVIGGSKNTDNQVAARETSVETFDFETSEWKVKSTIPLSLGSVEERNKQIHFKACFATIHRDVLENIIGTDVHVNHNWR